MLDETQDLSFVPAPPSGAHILTPDQIAHYNAQGFVQPFTVFDDPEIADMLVHGSLPNHSSRRRCGFTLRYCPPGVQITDPAWATGVEAILCRGDTGSWETHPRPDNNDITTTQSSHVVGNN